MVIQALALLQSYSPYTSRFHTVDEIDLHFLSRNIPVFFVFTLHCAFFVSGNCTLLRAVAPSVRYYLLRLEIYGNHGAHRDCHGSLSWDVSLCDFGHVELLRLRPPFASHWQATTL